MPKPTQPNRLLPEQALRLADPVARTEFSRPIAAPRAHHGSQKRSAELLHEFIGDIKVGVDVLDIVIVL